MEYIIKPALPALKIWPLRIEAPTIEADNNTLREEQFVNLYRTYYQELVLYATRFLKDPVRAQDAVQEVFLKLWKKRDSLDLRAAQKALIYKSVRNLCLNALRNDKTHEHLKQHIPEPAGMPGPLDTVEAAQLKKQINHWVSLMPPRRREVFELSRYNNLSYKEIGEVMGISVKTVENHILEALRSLRDKVRTYDPKLLQL